MNDADTAQDNIERGERLRNEERAARKVLTVEDSAGNCIDCDAMINSNRQLAIPGVQTCVDCQELIEARNR